MAVTTTNLKAQLQARIDADLSGHTLEQLLVLSKAAEDFEDLDLTNLETRLSTLDAGVDGSTTDTDLLKQAKAIPETVSIGEVKYVAPGAPPTGYLACNGAQVSKTTYAGLYAVLGDQSYLTGTATVIKTDLTGGLAIGTRSSSFQASWNGAKIGFALSNGHLTYSTDSGATWTTTVNNAQTYWYRTIFSFMNNGSTYRIIRNTATTTTYVLSGTSVSTSGNVLAMPRSVTTDGINRAVIVCVDDTIAYTNNGGASWVNQVAFAQGLANTLDHDDVQYDRYRDWFIFHDNPAMYQPAAALGSNSVANQKAYPICVGTDIAAGPSYNLHWGTNNANIYVVDVTDEGNITTALTFNTITLFGAGVYPAGVLAFGERYLLVLNDGRCLESSTPTNSSSWVEVANLKTVIPTMDNIQARLAPIDGGFLVVSTRATSTLHDLYFVEGRVPVTGQFYLPNIPDQNGLQAVIKY